MNNTLILNKVLKIKELRNFNTNLEKLLWEGFL